MSYNDDDSLAVPVNKALNIWNTRAFQLLRAHFLYHRNSDSREKMFQYNAIVDYQIVQIFACATTSQLSYHVHNFVTITSSVYNSYAIWIMMFVFLENIPLFESMNSWRRIGVALPIVQLLQLPLQTSLTHRSTHVSVVPLQPNIALFSERRDQPPSGVGGDGHPRAVNEIKHKFKVCFETVFITKLKHEYKSTEGVFSLV